jgi:hypothetical protein
MKDNSTSVRFVRPYVSSERSGFTRKHCFHTLEVGGRIFNVVYVIQGELERAGEENLTD